MRHTQYLDAQNRLLCLHTRLHHCDVWLCPGSRISRLVTPRRVRIKQRQREVQRVEARYAEHKATKKVHIHRSKLAGLCTCHIGKQLGMEPGVLWRPDKTLGALQQEVQQPLVVVQSESRTQVPQLT